jgi:hypothetical protein
LGWRLAGLRRLKIFLVGHGSTAALMMWALLSGAQLRG